ncbi:MAG: dTDP-glucose 4,6-dehydratase [Candidatus Omnitrophica bacterium]|nr:dTDP-glucose 4,6-dehydratase [Candidatus Omnitrophota bacterium]
MKILVTGGAGFIGSHFVRFLKKKYPEYDIVNLDKLTYAGNRASLRDLEGRAGYTFIKGDICDAGLLRDIVPGCQAIVNFAAETHVDRSIADASKFLATNVMGTYTLLEAALDSKTPRFIQISTDEVYGSIEQGSFTETSPLMPNSPYSASKAAGDHLARSYFVTYGLPAIVTRSSNNFGPYQFPEKVIPLFVTNLIEGKKVPLYGDGMNIRDWLFVEDNCLAIDCVLHRGIPGEIYNIGGSFEVPNRELTRMIVAECGAPETSIEFVPDRPGHDRRYSLDSTKVHSLGWRPQWNFQKALSYTVDWYRKNEWWWRPLKH